jgi:hypothetical protein
MTNSAAFREPDVNDRFTYADYKSWELAPGERYELIYGIPYKMIFDKALPAAAP